MAQIFARRTNLVARLSVPVVVIVAVAGLLWLARYSPAHSAGEAPVQPVLFSHLIHAGDLHIDCRYCHTSVESASFAGMPTTQTCMGCHGQVHVNSPLLKPVQDSMASGDPIPWVRVDKLPGYVYFDHSIHVAKGVACETCHGRVDQMATIAQAESFTMTWCLGCHRDPAKFLRPPDQVVTMGWQAPADQHALGTMLMQELDVKSKTSCSTCHR